MYPPTVYFSIRCALSAADWPSYYDARQARNMALRVLHEDYKGALGFLAAELAAELDCLPGRLLFRTDVKRQEIPTPFEGLYRSLERRLNARLDRLEQDEPLRPYTITAVARKDGLPVDRDSLRTVGKVLRRSVGSPAEGQRLIWRLPEDLFAGARFKS